MIIPHVKAVVLILLLLLNTGAFSQIGSSKALEFDGVNDYVEIKDHASLNPRDAMTVEAWIQPYSFGTNIYSNSILCKHNWSAGNKGYVLRCGANGNVSFIVSSRSSGAWVEANSTSSPIDVNKWYHIAGVFDGDSVKVYVNGELQAHALYSGQIDISSGANARIGQLSTGTGRNFDGMIDEVRLWDTAVDTKTLKKWMCRKLTSGHKYTGRLGAYWTLNEGTGTSTGDKSSNSNAGSINGAYWRGSGAPIGDNSVYSLNSENLKIGSQFGDTLKVSNINGSPDYVHLYLVNGKSEYEVDPYANAQIDTSHYYGVYIPESSSINADITLDYSGYSKVNSKNECSVDLFKRYPGDSTYWSSLGASLSTSGDSIYAKDRTNEEFVLIFYPKDSSNFISTVTGKPWYCKGDSVLILAGGGSGFTYQWFYNGVQIKGAAGNSIYAAKSGNYKAKATRTGTSCVFESAQLVISERQLPTVKFSALKSVCESVDTVILRGGSPAGGFYYGPTVYDSFFFPSRIGKGTYDLYYRFRDTAGCSSQDTQTIIVWSLPTLTLNRSIWTCDNLDSFELDHLSPANGTYSGLGVKNNYFFPDIVNGIPGYYAYTYSFTDTNGCSNQFDDSLELRRSTIAILNPIRNSCLGTGTIQLIGTPKGGAFKGNGVSGNSFDPDVAGIGSHDITYTYVNSVNCPSSNTKTAQVFKGTSVSWSFNQTACINSDSIALKNGDPSGGVFSGKGVRNSYFIPYLAGPGNHSIVYSYTDSNKCSNKASGSATVHDTSALSYTPIGLICPDHAPFAMSAISPNGGKYKGDAVVNDKDFDPSKANYGLNGVSYSYTNSNNCLSMYDFKVNMIKPDSIDIGLKDKACSNEGPIRLHLDPPGGKVTGNGIISTFFSPQAAGAGRHKLVYEVQDANNCKVLDSAIIRVGDVPEVSLMSFSSICENDAVSFAIEGLPMGGMSFVNNADADSFNSENWSAGLQTVKYVFYNQEGCGDSVESSFWMNFAPNKPIITLSDSTLVSSNALSYQWYDESGPIDGATERNYKPLGNGNYSVEIANDSGCKEISDEYLYDLIGLAQFDIGKLKVRPNPSKGLFNILSVNHKIREIQICNILGEVLISHKVYEYECDVDLSDFQAGTYQVRIRLDDGRLAFRKLVKL